MAKKEIRIIKPRRRVGRQYVTTTVTVPPWLVKRVEERAELEYGGNKSALWCASMLAYLGIVKPEELQK